jgi:hypothetical protein
MRSFMAALILAALGGAAHSDTLCPDGTFVPGDSCMLSFDGSHVIGGPVTLPRDTWPPVLYVEGRPVAIVRLRFDDEYRIGKPQRNRILDAPAGTPAIEIPRLAR